MIGGISSHSKMSGKRGRSPGWAAVDLKQMQKQDLKPEFDDGPYSPIQNMTATTAPSGSALLRNVPPVKSFSSVLQPKMEFPFLVDDNDSNGRVLENNSNRVLANKIIKENNTVLALTKLKELHGWADNSLIEDILAAVKDNFDQASTLLKNMVTSSSSEENKTVDLAEPSSVFVDCLHTKKTEEEGGDFPLEKMTDLAELKAVLQGCLDNKKPEHTDEGVIFENKLSNGTADLKLISRSLMSAPAEPEWEEDDVYLNHRKDAIRVMRSASQHSRAANNAFLRGDHFSAQQLSHKAREERKLAERLNAKAAEEILTIRNGENNIWKLDLHGLHAYEAVHALQNHLQKIETQIPLSRTISPNKVKPKVEITCRSSLGSPSCKGIEVKPDIQNYALSSQRRAILEVITGTGNHSRGEAALPSAIRSFLIENGYRFDEFRPGVIAVRPKFRNRSKH
ncbi:uncharacterized protein LOC122059498 [Macadamia integrifolia]|uniref:uncharacterized protein LOC122059498 n=1 Tax=Macadamia integrifolia TaxID=60698 RepID=UPI001C5295F8|nr:uncharacterized protein LOC122059498 [Macadamia integrifolia]XP_042478228.1 uncharacterized protein LOC122059498 [Macadamia integrifolia]